ncbi:hypothetical protein PROPEN_04365 [Proteus penneri ATCC 35198]|nr:hypothetical protein PROPEN_04365 [Proteus penneri ATCC 35198]
MAHKMLTAIPTALITPLFTGKKPIIVKIAILIANNVNALRHKPKIRK